MQKRGAAVFQVLLAGVFLSHGASAQCNGLIGSWKVNWSQSHVSDPPPKNLIRTYESVGSAIRVSETRIDENGRRTDVEYVARYDGKEYPVFTSTGNSRVLLPTADTVALVERGRCSVEGIGRENGIVIYRFRRFVSPTGNRLTVKIEGILPGGEQAWSRLVYERLHI